MEPADSGFKFHEDFAPFGLSAGNAAASSATDDSIALVECLSDTLKKLIADADSFSEAKKSNLEKQEDYAEGSAARIENEAHQKRRKVEPKLKNCVLGDFST